jgi:uncharacterized protein (UPF0248 family)
MKIVALVALGCFLVCGLAVALLLRVRYAITDNHLKVTLFGLRLRRIRLSDIERVSKRQSGPAEKWHNTLKPSHRILVIRRRRGLLKEFIITPRNRYTFKAELERAVARLSAVAEGKETQPPPASTFGAERPN